MYNFDFNILEPTEFEKLVADIVTAHENALHKTSFKVITQNSGPDSGVDFKLKDGEIIGQAKRYQDKNQLINSLKREKDKVSELKPKRYILIVSLPLTYKDRENIKHLFYPFILTESDIIDQTDLNRLLEEHRDILLRHNKLWLSSTHILQQVVGETVNKALNDQIWRNSARELKEIVDVKNYFVSTDFFPQGIEVLRKRNFLIITGDPGVGKTTLARALCHYFLEYRNYKDFYYHHGINAPLHIPDTKIKSIFFLDDFLGSTIYDKARIENIGFFQSFIEKIKDDGHLLIVTTREYIYQQEKKQNPRFRQLDGYKYIIRHTGYSDEEKLQILLNSVCKAELSHAAVDSLKSFASLIIKADNYRPKLIVEYIRNYPIDDSGLGWGYNLWRFLKFPYDHWESTFLEASAGAQLFLLCLFISNEPCRHTFLCQTFKSISQYRHVSLSGYEADTFNEAIRELSNTFIYLEKDTLTNEIVYTFANTFIEDFLLEYLRRNDHIIEHLIRGAIAYNQLFYAFTTQKDERLEINSYRLLFNGTKIWLNESLKEVLLNKVLNDFENLSEINIAKIKWSEQEITFEQKNKKDNKVRRLLTFIKQFDINRNIKAKIFVQTWIKRFSIWGNKDIPYDDDDFYYLNDDEIEMLPNLICALGRNITEVSKEVIESYYYRITRTSHYISFRELRKVYRQSFDNFLNKHKAEMVERLEDIICNDIISFRGFYNQYRDIYAYYALNKLFDSEIIEVFKLYNLKLTEKKWNEWLDLAEIERRKMVAKNENQDDNDEEVYDPRKNKTDVMINGALDDILPSPLKRLTSKEINNLITTTYPERSEQILLMASKKKYLYELIWYPYQFRPLINFCFQSDFAISDSKAGFVTRYIKHILQSSFTASEINAVIVFAEYTAQHDLKFFKRRQFDEYAKETDFESSIFEKMMSSDLLALNNGWYSFLIPEISPLLRAIYLLRQQQKREIYLFGEHPSNYGNFSEQWPYLEILDRTEFLSYFIYPRIERFYQTIYDSIPKKMVRKYFRFLGIRFNYKIVNGKAKCHMYVTSNETTNELFEYLNIWLSGKIFKNFPFESPYFKNDINEEHCGHLLRYIEKKFPEQQEKPVAIYAIRDQLFWELLMKTDLAELIMEEISRLGKYLDKLKSQLPSHLNEIKAVND